MGREHKGVNNRKQGPLRFILEASYHNSLFICLNSLKAYTFNDREEMDEFLENYKLPKLKHDEMINLNSSKTIKVIEFIIKSEKETSRPMFH